MVATAERNTVLEASRAMINPMYDMVNIAPAGRNRAPRKRTPAIAENDRAADRCGYGAAGAPDIQWFTPRPQHRRNDRGITRDTPRDVGVDRATQRQGG